MSSFPSRSFPAAAVAMTMIAGAALTVIALATRPLLPVDETRYLSVAWEMWHSGDWLVPRLNGELYGHKPPVLFWLILTAWKLFGVGETTARLISPLAGIASLALTAALAWRLWPAEQRRSVAALAPVILLGTLLWTVFATLTMFDVLMACATLVGALGIVRARTGRRLTGWGLFGLALGIGGLTKGPAIVVYLLPFAILAWFAGERGARPSGPAWTAGILAGVVVGIAVGLLWVGPAVLHGGDAFADEILWRQTASRMVESFAHRRPVWWYAALLPAVLLPWSLWPPAWRAVGSGLRRPLQQPGGLCGLWFVVSLGLFSLFSGKQIHYLLPLLPAFALAVAGGIAEAPRTIRFFDHRLPLAVLTAAGAALAVVGGARPDLLPLPLPADTPPWAGGAATILGVALLAAAALLGLAGATALRRQAAALLLGALTIVAALHGLGMPLARPGYDLRPMATRIASERAAGHDVAYAGDYQGEFHFLGRLTAPITEISESHIAGWLAAHPGGRVVVEIKIGAGLANDTTELFRQPSADRRLVMLAAKPPQ